jgi:hypothetical protein
MQEIMRRIDVGVFPIESEGEEAPRLAIVTGFYGERIAQPGVVVAQFNAQSAAPPIPGQPPGQVPPPPVAPPAPSDPPKPPPVDGEGAP